MDKGKKELIQRMDSEEKLLYDRNTAFYLQSMEDSIAAIHDQYHQESFEDELRSFLIRQSEMNELENKLLIVDSSKKTTRKHLALNLKRMLSAERKSFSQILEDYLDDKEIEEEKKKILKAARVSIDESAQEELLRFVIDEYDKFCEKAFEDFNRTSIDFWKDHTRLIREKMIELVSGTTVLDDSKKNELTGVILSYEDVVLEQKGEDIFNEDEFRKILLFNYHHYLKLDKLRDRYNTELDSAIKKIKEQIVRGHLDNVRRWADSLLGQLKEKITDYNPALRRMVELVNSHEETIQGLIIRQNRLEQYKQQVHKMIDWNEF